MLILSDSLSSLQAIRNMKYDHPLLTRIHSDLLQDAKEIVFFSGTLVTSANTTAEDALDGDISDELIPSLP